MRTTLLTVASGLALLICGLVPAQAAPGLSRDDYDARLCETAQRIIVNAPDLPVRVQWGEGNGFHTIQMDIDVDSGEAVVAMTSGRAEVDGRLLETYVACKMVNRDRVNDVLGLQLSGPLRSCRDVNEHTYAVALNTLSEVERARFEAAGRPLVFGDDYIAATGGEWLPALVDDFIAPLPADGGLQVRAPSVRVPWNTEERGFFQGTHHCKLISLAAMQHWLRAGTFAASPALFPRTAAACAGPATPAPGIGSCLFYFAPVDSMICEDYSGPDWTPDAAGDECGQRHASRDALRAAQNRYEGSGGVFSADRCAERSDVPARAGTCVFHCGDGDETLWQMPTGSATGGAAARMMDRACDLYVPAVP